MLSYSGKRKELLWVIFIGKRDHYVRKSKIFLNEMGLPSAVHYLLMFIFYLLLFIIYLSHRYYLPVSINVIKMIF